jgi:methylated-DNA-[protein]-cysteine S-methyltransferase
MSNIGFTLDRIPSPVGELLAVTDAQGRLRALDFEDYEPRLARLLGRHYGAAAAAPPSGRAPAPLREALDAYFAGRLDAIDAISVETGGTDFQRRVWAALRRIPAATTTSYGALADALGAPSASRAVGLANGSNPICIVVPCHRVIGADGRLTGYGGGLPRKRWLLAHEARFAETATPRLAFA